VFSELTFEENGYKRFKHFSAQRSIVPPQHGHSSQLLCDCAPTLNEAKSTKIHVRCPDDGFIVESAVEEKSAIFDCQQRSDHRLGYLLQ